jgi:hypothetical protein
MNLNLLFSHSITNKVIINLSMICMSMKNQISRQINSIQIIEPNSGDRTRREAEVEASTGLYDDIPV